MRLFLYRLAALHGVLDVDALAAAIPLRVLKGWMAFWSVEPFGDDWARSGKLAAVMAKASGAEIDTEFEAKFLPSWRSPEQTEEEMIAELKKIPGFAEQLEQKGY